MREGGFLCQAGCSHPSVCVASLNNLHKPRDTTSLFAPKNQQAYCYIIELEGFTVCLVKVYLEWNVVICRYLKVLACG